MVIRPHLSYTFVLKDAETRQISKMTGVLRTEICYVNKQVNVSSLSTNI